MEKGNKNMRPEKMQRASDNRADGGSPFTPALGLCAASEVLGSLTQCQSL